MKYKVTLVADCERHRNVVEIHVDAPTPITALGVAMLEVKKNQNLSNIGDFHAVTVLALHVATEGVISIEMNGKAVPPIKEG